MVPSDLVLLTLLVLLLIVLIIPVGAAGSTRCGSCGTGSKTGPPTTASFAARLGRRSFLLSSPELSDTKVYEP